MSHHCLNSVFLNKEFLISVTSDLSVLSFMDHVLVSYLRKLKVFFLFSSMSFIVVKAILSPLNCCDFIINQFCILCVVLFLDSILFH